VHLHVVVGAVEADLLGAEAQQPNPALQPVLHHGQDPPVEQYEVGAEPPLATRRHFKQNKICHDPDKWLPFGPAVGG